MFEISSHVRLQSTALQCTKSPFFVVYHFNEHKETECQRPLPLPAHPRILSLLAQALATFIPHPVCGAGEDQSATTMTTTQMDGGRQCKLNKQMNNVTITSNAVDLG